MAFKVTPNMPFSLVLQKLSSFYASSEIFNVVLFMVSYILITGYSILLFMNPLNFNCLQFYSTHFFSIVFKLKNDWKITIVKKRKKRDQNIKKRKEAFLHVPRDLARPERSCRLEQSRI